MPSGRSAKARVWTAERVRRYRATGEVPSPVMVWTSQQISIFPKRAARHEQYALFLLLAFTGMRQGEAVGLRGADVDPEAKVVRVARQAVQNGWEVEEAEPKSESSIRPVPSAPSLGPGGRDLMIGFEIEIDLAVTDANGDPIDGDTDLATSTTVPGFKLVSDSRSLNDDGDYSNLEFVTDAVSVIGGQSVVGPQALHAQFLEVQRIRDVLYNAGSAPLQGVDGTLTATGEGLTARLDPTLDYDESGALLVHYSVGIPLAGMPHFFDRLRAVAPVLPWAQGDNSALIRDRFNLHRARLFAASELQIFCGQPQAPQAGSREARSLDGYLQLAYMQICALADHLDYNGTGGNIKNLTVVLCRSAFIDIFPLLPVVAQQYLANRCAGEGPIVGNLADFQEEPEPGYQGRHTYWEDGIRQSSEDLDPITLAAFTASVLTGNARVDPEQVFGGMREIAPHLEENVRVVPMEVRSINNEAKTWNEVQNELANLCTWCQEAFLLA